ncbi:unnamed protein product [Darwinula stevensoni]|uniref:Uncharacterized protein n=1 Tax=Darwinula stevensoni TaxID=69355 RepID=A0A7R8X2A7_9CRUS|nr:unnamed protein product [Darwinula stevensoni]CAG0883750.1 unnamed protein product [Darwinula stevensoni]
MKFDRRTAVLGCLSVLVFVVEDAEGKAFPGDAGDAEVMDRSIDAVDKGFSVVQHELSDAEKKKVNETVRFIMEYLQNDFVNDLQKKIQSDGLQPLLLNDSSYGHVTLKNGQLTGLEKIRMSHSPEVTFLEGAKLQVSADLELPDLLTQYDVSRWVSLGPFGGFSIDGKANVKMDVGFPVKMDSTPRSLIGTATCVQMLDGFLRADNIRVDVHLSGFIGSIIETIQSWFNVNLEGSVLGNLKDVLSNLILKALEAIVCVAVDGLATLATAGK